ncbi:hypothetical protein PCANC_18451 [Puccinia coronata f. sp. avenae]|uniref:Uncharacterized protein n=1 Tax=Puccinia coronata f. sp. avenae TaxID=200324 RepID=A0A2N5SDY5_9BASI|nr:hypothetical protein PCANC_18451 [Puccinia coronata f. sp. avenae]
MIHKIVKALLRTTQNHFLHQTTTKAKTIICQLSTTAARKTANALELQQKLPPQEALLDSEQPSLSDHEISAFYKALVSPTEPKTSIETITERTELVLKPKDTNDLLQLSNPADLGSHQRKHIIHNLAPILLPKLSTLEQHLQAISINILKKELPWYALLQSAAIDNDLDDLKLILKSLKDYGHDQTLVFGHTLPLIKAISDPKQAERMRDVLLEAGDQLGLSSSSAYHHVEVHRLLHLTANKPTDAFQTADKYVRRLEKAADPPGPEVYLQLFDFINHASMKRSTSIDLFNRLRLLAHPNPPISIWNALLRALASGASTQPERAMDTFLNLKASGESPTVETYNHLIRSMIRARRAAIGTFDRKTGYEKWYYSALRLLKQMIDDDGLRPNMGTFLVLLEGAKRLGDLERAKWTYGLFLAQLEHERNNPLTNSQEAAWMHVSAATSLFQTYASFSPANKYLLTQQQKKKNNQTQALIQPSLNDPHFFKKIPQTTPEILAETELILAQFINSQFPHQSHIRTRHRADQRQLSMLMSSYLSVYSSHSTIEELCAKYRMYTHPISDFNQGEFGAVRISWTYLILLERCEFLRSAQKAGQVAREIFPEWRANQAALSQFELVQSVDSRLISQIWAAWIRLQAKYGSTEEAMKELERFYKTYPPKFLPKPNQARKGVDLEGQSGALTRAQSRPIASSELTNQILNSPYLAFQHLEILHHKLKLVEDHRSINRLKTIVKKYENARRIAYDLNELERITHMQKGY